MTSDDGFIIELLIKKNVASDIAVQSAREAIEEDGEVVTDTSLLERLTDDLNIPSERVLEALSEEFNMKIGHVNEVLLADEIKEFFPTISFKNTKSSQYRSMMLKQKLQFQIHLT